MTQLAKSSSPRGVSSAFSRILKTPPSMERRRHLKVPPTGVVTPIFCDGADNSLVNDTEDVEDSDDADILGSLTLSIVEVDGDGDDGVGGFLSEVSFCGYFHPGQNHSGHL
jgi:hypothetical protein